VRNDLRYQAAGLSLDTGVGADGGVHDEVVEHFDPGVVLGKIIVEFRRDFPDQRQPRSGNGGEVVVLVVVADVPRDCVERAVVGVGFEALGEHVVLGDEVTLKWSCQAIGNRSNNLITCNGMQSHGHQSSSDEISEHFPSETINDDCIKSDLDDEIDEFELRGGLGIHSQGTDEVEERLEAHPAELAEGRAEELRL
jgi:hypothetical protein